MNEELSDEQRSQVFASANARASAPNSGRGIRRPPKAALWLLAAVAVLGVGGQIANHYLANLGAGTPLATPTTRVTKPTSPATTTNGQNFIGYRPIATATAPNFTLLDQGDRRWTLSAHRSQIVILAFYNANCLDICPVLGAELRSALLSLGTRANGVSLAVVNSDPRDRTVRQLPAALAVPKLTGLANVVFLTGSLQELNQVWTAYGVTVTVGARASETSHSNVLYFIGKNTALAGLARPFATITPSGRYTTSRSDAARFAQGVAQVLGSLIG